MNNKQGDQEDSPEAADLSEIDIDFGSPEAQQVFSEGNFDQVSFNVQDSGSKEIELKTEETPQNKVVIQPDRQTIPAPFDDQFKR